MRDTALPWGVRGPVDWSHGRVRCANSRNASNPTCVKTYRRCGRPVVVHPSSFAKGDADCPGAGRGGVWVCILTFQPPAALTIAAIPARIAGGRSGHAATTAANSGSVGFGGVAGGVGGPKPASLLPDLLPPDLPTPAFPEGNRDCSSPSGGTSLKAPGDRGFFRDRRIPASPGMGRIGHRRGLCLASRVVARGSRQTMRRGS